MAKDLAHRDHPNKLAVAENRDVPITTDRHTMDGKRQAVFQFERLDWRGHEISHSTVFPFRPIEAEPKQRIAFREDTHELRRFHDQGTTGPRGDHPPQDFSHRRFR